MRRRRLAHHRLRGRPAWLSRRPDRRASGRVLQVPGRSRPRRLHGRPAAWAGRVLPAENGFRVGLHGGGYANVCSGPTEQSFVNGYQWGRQIHEARSELNNNQARLRNARDGLSRTDAAIAAPRRSCCCRTCPRSAASSSQGAGAAGPGADGIQLPHRPPERADPAARVQRAAARAAESVSALTRQTRAPRERPRCALGARCRAQPRAALYARFASRGGADFQKRLLSAMRHAFGGHPEPPPQP